MKIQLHAIVIGMLTIAISCKKNDEGPPAPRPWSPSPTVYMDLSKEVFWACLWQKDSSDYKITIQTPRLTDSALKKGIGVYIAFYTEMTTFEELPLTLTPPLVHDTTYISFVATTGQLLLTAKSPVDLTWGTDVLIQY